MQSISLLSSIGFAWQEISPLLMNLLSFILFILIGFLLAKGAGLLLSTLLKLIMLDNLSKSIGINYLLEKGNVKRTLSELIGDLGYWLIIFLSVVSVANWNQLPIQPALNKVFDFLGLILMAAIVLVIGAFFASLFSAIVRFLAANFGVDEARVISRVIYYIIIIFSFLAALSQLGVNPELFLPHVNVIIGAIGLAAAIAFGLGCKDMAADFLHNFFKGKN
jgi:small-conductance mechanosensitive channel